LKCPPSADGRASLCGEWGQMVVLSQTAARPSPLMRPGGIQRGLPDYRYRVPATSRYGVSFPYQHLRRMETWRPTELVHVPASREPAEDFLEAPGLTQLRQEPYTLLPLFSDNARAVAACVDYRLTVVLAADTVAYTRRMAKDEAGMHESCMAIYRDIIAPGIVHHDARIIKHTGDGFLAEFASATRAVWFAVVFQNAMREWNARKGRRQQLRFRIGINLGDVYVEPHDVFGHNVNIAARMQESAKPGGVLISHAVATSVRDARLQFEDAGDLALRHIDEPVRAFHVRLSRQRRRNSGSQSVAGESASQCRC
jgi:class 3 adenylate cyclase